MFLTRASKKQAEVALPQDMSFFASIASQLSSHQFRSFAATYDGFGIIAVDGDASVCKPIEADRDERGSWVYSELLILSVNPLADPKPTTLGQDSRRY